MGVTDDRLDRINGPIGFIPAARDPDTLALSVLGEVVCAHKAAGDAARPATSLVSQGRALRSDLLEPVPPS